MFDKYVGKGDFLKNGRERVDFGKLIGKYYDCNIGEYVEIIKGLIYYGKDGVYIVLFRL